MVLLEVFFFSVHHYFGFAFGIAFVFAFGRNFRLRIDLRMTTHKDSDQSLAAMLETQRKLGKKMKGLKQEMEQVKVEVRSMSTALHELCGMIRKDRQVAATHRRSQGSSAAVLKNKRRFWKSKSKHNPLAPTTGTRAANLTESIGSPTTNTSRWTLDVYHQR